MIKSNHKGNATSVEIPLTKENTMKAHNIKKKNTGRYAVFTVLAAGCIVIAFGLIAQPLMAKGRGWYGPGRSADEIVQTLTERLDLAAEQVDAVRPIIEKKTALMKEIRDKKGAYKKQARSDMHKLMLDTDIQLGRILTDDQVDKYIELKLEHREQMHRGKFRGGKMRGQYSKTPAQKIERLRTLLDLTEEQTVQIEPIIKESMAKQQLIRQDMRDEMQAIGDETHEQLSTILTSKQMEELNVIKEERRARMEKRMDRPGRMGF